MTARDENLGCRSARCRGWIARRLAGVIAVALLPVATGCVVEQKPGAGKVLHLYEARTGAGYYLYLPKDYGPPDDVNAPDDSRHPLVVTFHGMKPFDTAGAQVREWQQEADRYGFVVCAPVLATPDTTSPLPLGRVTLALRRDERATLAIMDEVLRTTHVDPGAVLATCWSYGGYLAHYMVNRHPEYFTCLAVKQSNFDARILNDATVTRYRQMPVAIFYTEHDLAICRRESQAAGNWYARRGFDLTFAKFADRGHERTPGPAAAFFARACGAKPNSPPWELAFLQVVEPVTPEAGASGAGTVLAGGEVPAERVADLRNAPFRPPPSRASGARAALARPSARGVPVGSAAAGTPRTPVMPNGGASPSIVRVRLSKRIDISPVLVTFRAVVPSYLRPDASYLWMLDGEPIANGPGGQKLIVTPGDHVLSVLVTDRSGNEHRGADTVTVLERLGDAPERRK